MEGAPATKKNLRIFGLAFVVVFVLLALFGKYVWKWETANTWAVVFLALAVVFLVPSLFAPGVLRPLYGPWVKFGFVLGVIVTTILMSVLFIIVVPIFSLIRLKDPLRVRRSRDPNESFWEPHTNSEPTIERFARPF